MRSKLLLLLALGVCTQMHARQTPEQLLKRRPLIPKYNTATAAILKKQFAANESAQNKGTATQDRLIAYAYYNQGMLGDTSRYWYSGSRGSSLNNLVFDSYVNATFSSTGRTLAPVPLDVDRSTPALMFDSAKGDLELGGGAYITSSMIRQYGANTMTEIQKFRGDLGGFTIRNHSKRVLSYDASGKLVTNVSTYDSTSAQNGPFLPSYTGYYLYSNNRSSSDSLVDNSGSSTAAAGNVRYAYDGSGNLTQSTYQEWSGGAWVDVTKDIYTYTPANKLSTHIYQEWDGTGMAWMTNSADTFSYTGNNLTRNVSYQRDPGTGLWGDGYATDNYYNAAGDLDSQYLSVMGTSGIMPVNKSIYSYTSFNHYDRVNSYSHDGTSYSATPDDYYKFYYETYTTGVDKVSKSRNDISIYPVPAKEALNIRFDGMAGNNITVTIYNMAGQKIQQSSLRNGMMQVTVSTLTPGNYVVEVSDENGSQRILFVK